ncbi:MAG: MBL fold metallo-hydrolase [Bacteroidota bacterium]
MINVLDLKFLDSTSTIAAFLVKAEAEYVLFETGPYSTFPQIKKELARFDLSIEDIHHVFLTHIHFDHAGAAWAFAKAGANVYLHPFGKKHLQDPSRLYKSARRIYQDKMEYLWGEMKQIPEEQLKVVEHEEVITIDGLNIKALHTPGHAVHHIAWKIGTQIIAGDVAGVRINSDLVVPPCPPPDIHVEDWQASIEILRKEAATALYLTHFGRVEVVEKHLNELENILLDWANWIKPYFDTDRPQPEIVPKFQAYVSKQLQAAGITDKVDIERYEKANPSWMSVAGLMRYWKKRKQTSEK